MKIIFTAPLCCGLILSLGACGREKEKETPAVPVQEEVRQEEEAATPQEAPASTLEEAAPQVPVGPAPEAATPPGPADELPAIQLKAETPKALFDIFKSLMLSKRYDAIYDLLSKGARAQIDTMPAVLTASMEEMKRAIDAVPPDNQAQAHAAQQEQLQQMFGVDSIEELGQMSGRDLFARMIERSARKEGDKLAELAQAEVVNTTVNPDGTAITTIRDAAGRESRGVVVLEDGSWKLDLTGELEGAHPSEE